MVTENELPLEFVTRYFKLVSNPALNDDLSAWNYVEELIHLSPEKAWALLLGLLHFAPSKSILCNIGAGHLEDLLKTHGVALLPKVREEAMHDCRVRAALYCVRITPDCEVYSQFEQLRHFLELDILNPLDSLADETFSAFE